MAYIDMESGKSRREFFAAAAHITIGPFEEGEISLRRHQCPGLGDALTVHSDGAGQYQGLRLRPVRSQTPLPDYRIETLPLRHRCT
jgi:hypothetical protein